MKLSLSKFFAGLFALCLSASTLLSSEQAVVDLLKEAQQDYLRGNLTEAKIKFDLVLKLEPANITARNYSKRLAAEIAKANADKGPSNSLKDSIQGIKIPKVEFREASLAEALEYLRQKGSEVSGGKVPLNFILQLDEQAKSRKISLTLNDAPLSESLRYIGELADVQFEYEKYAVVVKPKGAKPSAPAPLPAGGSGSDGKIKGLN